MKSITKFSLQSKLQVWAAVSLTMLGTMAMPAAVIAATAPMTGCTVSVSQIANDAIAVAKVASQIATAVTDLYPSIAAQVSIYAADVTTVATAVLAGTSTEAKLVAALQALDGVLAAIPSTVTQTIAAFIPIAIAGIEAIYSYVGTTSVVLAKAPLKSVNSAWSSAAKGVKVHHRFGRSREGDFKATWNDAVKAHPNAGFVRI